MEDTLCGPSAFKFHRVPPQVLALCPPMGSSNSRFYRQPELKHPLIADVLGPPIHRLVLGAGACRSTRNFIRHQWTQELPFGAIQPTDLGFDVTSPLFTLLMLATKIARERLAMVAYELCGSFAVYRPTTAVERALADPANAAASKVSGAWRRVKSTKGELTSLWSRNPLVELDELKHFAASTRGLRGNRNLAWAAGCVLGVAASPLEVQTAMLLGLPTTRGGRNYENLQLNHRIGLSADARRLSGKTQAVADIYLEAPDCRPLDIECQGGIVHDSTSAALGDSRRSLALQSMGIDVIPVTFDQLYDVPSFDALCAMLDKRLGRPHAARTEASIKRERNLRRHLFCDWEKIAC